MNILENEIEDILFNAITRHPDELFDRGFNILDGHKYLRQVDLGDYG